MTSTENLHGLFEHAVSTYPNRVAAQDHSGKVSYAELGSLSDQVRDRLRALRVTAGDRVGIYLRKSIDSLAAILGVLKCGAAYVPVGPDVPAVRNAFVFNDCSVAAIIVERAFADALRASGNDFPSSSMLILERSGGGAGLAETLEKENRQKPATASESADVSPDYVAYILYTSGSTGIPKGVVLTHGNGVSFVDWCSEVLQPNSDDCFSSHAPFHFDLSILDIYVSLKHGARLVLIGEDVGKDPRRLSHLICEAGITIWYSTPSVLTLLTEYGRLDQQDLSHLRTVLFAGEVFPIKHLRALSRILPGRRYLNLYGPTETNVCTYYEIPSVISDDQAEPYPIGMACSHLETRVLSDTATAVIPGSEGELCVRGSGVMQGYWNRAEQTEAAFVTDADRQRWYRTGDVVVEGPDGNYRFVGRRDRMVKRRGFRVELGEIEAALYSHRAIKEAAVISIEDSADGVRVHAYLSVIGSRPSLIELKTHCAEKVPVYMVPDTFSFLAALPKTSTDKIDYERLKSLVRMSTG